MEPRETDSASQGTGVPPRKTYRSPFLTTFGSVGSLTQTLMLTIGADGASGSGMSKTS
jgi:hypothetical protein